MENQFSGLNRRYPNLFPNLRSSSTLLSASDYSGESKDSRFLVFSFLIITAESLLDWDEVRLDVRCNYLPNARRMSFKRLGDKYRQRALLPFLDASKHLQGILFSIAVDKRAMPIFKSPPLDLRNPEFQSFKKWKVDVLEKAFFAAHALSFLISGLGAPAQNVVWLTDEDEIAANVERLTSLTKLFGWIISNYLTHDIGHIRCGTTKSDSGTRQIEDLVAIPDLAAGALSEQVNLPMPSSEKPGDFFWIYRPEMTEKTRQITNWISDADGQLKQLFAVLEPSSDGSGQVVSCHHFYNKVGP